MSVWGGDMGADMIGATAPMTRATEMKIREYILRSVEWVNKRERYQAVNGKLWLESKQRLMKSM